MNADEVKEAVKSARKLRDHLSKALAIMVVELDDESNSVEKELDSQFDGLQVNWDGELSFGGWYKEQGYDLKIPEGLLQVGIEEVPAWAQAEKQRRIGERERYEARVSELKRKKLASEAEKDRAEIERLKQKHGWSE